MRQPYPAPPLVLSTMHLRSVRLYLSELTGRTGRISPISQAEMAAVFGYTPNAWAVLERGNSTPPDILLRCVQTHLHYEHLRHHCYQDDAQSLQLLLDFHQQLSGKDSQPHQDGTDPLLLRLLYEIGWQFGGVVMDGYKLSLGNGPLTLTPAFGANRKFRIQQVALLDMAVRPPHERNYDGKPTVPTSHLREQLHVLKPIHPPGYVQEVVCDHFKISLQDNQLTIAIDESRRVWLSDQFRLAGEQARHEAVMVFATSNPAEQFYRLLAKCSVNNRTGKILMRNFIATDKRAKFLQLAMLEQCVIALLYGEHAGGDQWNHPALQTASHRGKRLWATGTAAGVEIPIHHALWSALHEGRRQAATALLAVSLDGRDLEISFEQSAQYLLNRTPVY
ncbi:MULTISPECIES: hypothetical protein [unclassified Aeromonas]|uniref:hypothetical protein n=1 Tax=unclassified Aeromonas TaxID=257493 RepID=UPI0022E3E021|nr:MULTISPECIES: hypothetical protein [unclassified Aeromonas]